MYRTVSVRADFSDEDKAFWVFQCENANNLWNCATYYSKQKHYKWLEQQPEAYTTYWKDEILRYGWKTYKCSTKYAELCRELKDNPHYKAMAAQSAQQTLKSVAESITSYNQLVGLYYKGQVDRPKLLRYRKKGGLAAVTFPRQALTYKEGLFCPSISKESKPDLLTKITLQAPDFIDPDWVNEVTVRPYLGQLWIDWVIDDGKKPVESNPNLDYSQAWSFDHGGDNWLTGVSTHGKSLIIDGRKLKSMNQGYARLVAKYKTGKPEFYWDSNLDRVQRKRNNQMRDAINKAARFIINRCLSDRVGNLIIGWNERQKDSINIGKRGNQNFVVIPTKRLINRLEQLCPEYGIKLTITEEAYTSKASCLDKDSLPNYGEKPKNWKPSGKRVKRGLYKTSSGCLINADCNGATNIARKVATQLGIDLAKVSREFLTVPHRYDIFKSLKKSYRTRLLRSTVSTCHVTTS
ncbi:MAG: IS200/IS605 family element transposase accessory protein TnpB [Moorea sp. SIO3I7]|uniref:RNA-guided endonuclease InsQ/TnpB family protein n=1 Tax=Moorena producens TaxID=1155739 RepID=UPI0013BF2B7C|nr:IS200/IS605 family element transposase accessory protein TnpB [Moorena sp. SIO3I7]NEO04651.1 IS200/IS605 family element transposase accessory protein TnpB [Moorena sp. SIO3I8]NEO47221.1 IS200/IS605 family element transposase accessory protein TnpB [Moorena sp. SIO4A3]NEP24425.1 IS200/IS605 family element transposase accessory protein TnpB [Moorena sp. SIO3I6]NEQ56612.1 IS200/IS605 family element transposase accessory protein TnpB [Moorena sp. SIO4A1]